MSSYLIEAEDCDRRTEVSCAAQPAQVMSGREERGRRTEERTQTESSFSNVNITE